MTFRRQALQQIRQALEAASQVAERPAACLLAVSKTQPAEAVEALAHLGQRAFGENYVREALAKIAALGHLDLEWHFIGHLQSNKCPEVAAHFDWVQSLDRLKLVEALASHRPPDRPALNVLIQVNIDDEAGKSGCPPGQVGELARAIAAAPGLRLRGLMAIPKPAPELADRRASFRRLRECFDDLKREFPAIDTLSMGMSEDFQLAIEEGATMVRIGSALFGPRS